MFKLGDNQNHFCSVLFDYQDMAKTLEGPGSFVAMQCDVSREDDVTRLFKVINDEHKGVDVCINNAGINHGAATLLDGDTSQWAEMLNVRVDYHEAEIAVSHNPVDIHLSILVLSTR